MNGLPVETYVQFAVPKSAEASPDDAGELCGQRHACRDGKTVAQRTGRYLDTRGLGADVPGEAAPALGVAVQLGDGHEAGLGQGGVDDRGGVPLLTTRRSRSGQSGRVQPTTALI